MRAMLYFLMGTIISTSSVGSWALEPLTCKKLKSEVAAKSQPHAQLHHFLDLQWEWSMYENPEWATIVGYPGQDGRWSEYSLAAAARRKELTKCSQQVLRQIPHKKLKDADRLYWELYDSALTRDIEGFAFPTELLPVDHMRGAHAELVETLNRMPTDSLAQWRNILARLEGVPQVLAQVEALLREGLKRQVTPVRMFMTRVPGQIEQLMAKPLSDNSWVKMFSSAPPELRAEAHKIAEEKILPALKNFKKFLENEYIPNCRETIAWTSLPNGAAWYAYGVKSSTTTNLTPEAIHELGLKEVARLAAEMSQIREQLKFTGTAAGFNRQLLSNPKFYYKDKEELVSGYRDIGKRIDGVVPKLFGRLPRLPYGVSPAPDYLEKNVSTAYYHKGNLQNGVAGTVMVNTYDLKSRPRWAMEAIMLHEGVPGHHLQIALSQEIENAPEFVRNSYYQAFMEGWGLYAESLGDELGFYKDPYSKYGQLSLEIWRAIRLVVDTGVHIKGWTREQAVQYFLDNMPKTRLDAEIEVDRYITWPGQALSYKIGQLKFMELRKRATEALGERFNVREFHDVVLGAGALPLDVLETRVVEWITSKQKPAQQQAAQQKPAQQKQKRASKN